MLHAAVAAGHPATVAAGIEILDEGGSAADAAVAACLASCVAETVMTGLLGGGYAIYWDGSDAWSLDCFVDVPSGKGAPPVELKVPFGEELVHYAVGPGTCAVPGLPRGLGALHARFGRLPWERLVRPALALARSGVTMPPAHAACLAMLAPVFTMQPDGARIYAPAGRPLEAGELLDQPGIARALELLAAEGADSPYLGTLADALVSSVEGIPVSRADLERYEARWERPAEVGWAGHRFLTRAGLSGVPETLALLPQLRELDAAARVHALLGALAGPGTEGHTTNLVTADAEGHACVLTSSLGLGTGDFLPGLDLQLNSMLGEVDLVREPLRAGERMESMMAPSLALDGKGSRSRSAQRAERGSAPRSWASPPASSTRGSSRPTPSGGLASTAPATSSTPNPESTSRRSRSWRPRACTSGAGRRSTTTSAASA